MVTCAYYSTELVSKYLVSILVVVADYAMRTQKLTYLIFEYKASYISLFLILTLLSIVLKNEGFLFRLQLYTVFTAFQLICISGMVLADERPGN